MIGGGSRRKKEQGRGWLEERAKGKELRPFSCWCWGFIFGARTLPGPLLFTRLFLLRKNTRIKMLIFVQLLKFIINIFLIHILCFRFTINHFNCKKNIFNYCDKFRPRLGIMNNPIINPHTFY